MLTTVSQSSPEPMRVLFACVPQTGHLTPLLPLATQLAAQGAEVIVASGPTLTGTVTGCGLSFSRVCPDFDDWFVALAARTRGRPGDGLAADRVERYFVPRLFAEIGLDLMLDGLTQLVRDARPDLLVFEPYALAAPLAAASCGVEAVQHAVGLRFDPLVLELVSDAVTPAWRAADLDVPAAAGLYDGTTLAICPPSLDPADGADSGTVQRLRPTALPAPGALLPVELAYPDRPLVYVTLGTFSNNDVPLFALILRALAELPVTVLVTTGRDTDPDALGAVPGNALVSGFVPQSLVLPHCAAVVHHAGAGTTFGALAHALPAVALPQSADNFAIAGRLAAAGAARVLMPGEVSHDAVRDAVLSVLQEPVWRHHAERIASEIAAMPDPAEVATMLRNTHVPLSVRQGKAIR